MKIKLPVGDGRLEDYTLREPIVFEKPARAFTRKALGAAHLVADPLSSKEPWLDTAIACAGPPACRWAPAMTARQLSITSSESSSAPPSGVRCSR